MKASARYFIGASGSPNFGDELIADLWCHELKARYPGTTIICDSFCSDFHRASGRIEGVEYWGALWQLAWRIDHVELIKANQTLPLNSIPIDAWGYTLFELVVERLSAYDVESIHVVGGGYINEMWPSGYFLVLIAAILAKRLDAPLYITGVGLFPGNKQALRVIHAALQYASFIEVRDEQSFAFLQDATPDVAAIDGCDDVAILNTEALTTLVFKDEAPHLAFVVQPGELGIDTGTIDFRSMREIMSERSLAGIQLIECSPNDGSFIRQPVEALAVELGVPLIIRPLFVSLRDGFPVFVNGFTVTTRFHVHAVSAMLGASGAVIAKNQYYRVKHSCVSRIADRNWLLDDEGSAEVAKGPKVYKAAKRSLVEKIYPYDGEEQ